MEIGAPKATPQTHQLGGGHGKKNGEVNSPTPDNQCAGRPVTLQGSAGRSCITPRPRTGTRTTPAPTEPPRILLTGPPGCGKTTAVLRTLPLLSQETAGFYTEEIRSRGGGGRLGFDVVALDGRRGPLARVDRSGARVGKYAVDLESFEAVGVRALETALREPRTVLVIDELGKMEFLSARFVALLERAFQGPNPLLGTVLYRSHPVADRFRRVPGVELIQVTGRNRDALPGELARRLSPAARPPLDRPPR